MSSKRNITYKCPYCDKRFNKENLVIHVGNKHDEMIPENYSAFRLVFDYVNKKPSGYNGKCIICGNESGWDEEKGKYNRLCSNPACKKKYIQSFEERMIRSKGVKRISSTAEGQAKMLANRKISGEYKFQDGGVRTFTGTYEKKALEFMDKVINIKSEDVSTPGPIMEYMFEGKKHIYISDIYYVPYNLIIEVKDGGDNPNNRSMPEYRAKQIAKEKWIIKNTDFNYLRLTNNDFSQLLAVFMELKMEMTNDTPERVIRINEGYIDNEAKWIDDGDCFICSKCGKAYGWTSIDQLSNFCPECGRKMIAVIKESKEHSPNFKSDEDLLEWMKKNIKYSNYTKLKSHDEVLKSKKGSCHDQVMFEYEELKKLGYSPKGLFIIELDKNGQGGMTHSLVYYKKGDKVCWFENAWKGQEGIGEHNSLKDIKDIFIDMYNNYGWGNIRKYGKLEFKSFSIPAHKPGETLQQFVDISLGNTNESCISFNESINKNEYHPIYLISMNYKAPLEKPIKLFTGSEYTHSGLIIDDEFDKIYSFNGNHSKAMSGRFLGGFSVESFSKIESVNPDGIMTISVMFIKNKYYEKIVDKINSYKTNNSDTKYNIMGVVGLLAIPPINKMTITKENKMFCSQFVDYMLKYLDIDLTNKASNLVTPKNIANIKNDKVYNLYTGPMKDFDIKKCISMTKNLSKKSDTDYITEYDIIYNDEVSIEEGFLKSEPDILYNKEAFDNGDINICFITGHSGSGKSTLAHSKESNTIEVYELDDLQCIADRFTMANLKEYGDLIYTYFKGPGKQFYTTWDQLKEDMTPGKDYEDKLYPGFVAYAIDWAKKHKDKKYILEGVWLFCNDETGKPYFEPSYFKDYAFYIKGTSAVKSKWRAAKRDMKYDMKEESHNRLFWIKSFTKSFFLKNWKWYKFDEKRIQVFRDYFKDKPETILSESYIEETSIAHPKKLYFVSKDNMDNSTLQPRIPSNYMTKNNYEENKTPRVCFAPSIDKCLMALGENLSDEKLFVHIVDDISKYEILKPDTSEVPDSGITNEYWICSPVKIKCIGQIICRDTGVTDDGIPYTYGDGKSASLYKWDWEWIKQFNESKDASVIEDDFKKKSGKSFKLIDLNTKEALKYVSDKWRNGKECRLAICKEDDKLAGYIYWNKSGTIAPMEVYKDYRGYGLSETLMKEAIKNGGNKLGVYSDNEVAIRLYKKLGFVETGRKKYKDGDEVIIMDLKSSLNESKNKSTLDDNFKKKKIDFKYYKLDINDSDAKKYLETNSFCKKYLNYISKNSGEILVDKDNDKLIGYIWVGKSKDRGLITGLDILNNYKGYGLSEILLKDAINNYGAIHLTVDPDNKIAIHLYEKFGFVIVNYYNDNSGEYYYMKLESKLNKKEKEDVEKFKLQNVSEAYTKELGKIQKDPEIIDSYGFISSDGIYNENVKIKGYNKWLRGRSELLIIDKGKVYLKKDPKKGYSIPGGGWEKDEDHNLSAIRETNEEARIKVKNVNYVSSYVAYFPPKDWVKEKISKENWWYGEYIELYIGEYDGQYKGKVEKIDQDKAMESGKFYNIKSIYNDLIPVHQEALSDIINEASISNYNFLDIKSNKSKALEYLKANSETKSYAEDTIKNYNGELVIYNDIMIGRILVGDNRDKGFITDFSIDEEHRGNRLGSKLIDDAINKYHGYDLLVDKDNKLALDMYKRRGFVIVKTYKNQYYMKLESKLKEDTIMMNEAMNALLTGYIPGSVDNPNNTYIVNYMQNNVFSGEDPNEDCIGVSSDPLFTNMIIRDKNSMLKRVDESFLKDKDYKVYIIEKSIDEVNDLISANIGNFVKYGYLYETLTGKKLYSKDQVGLEGVLIPVMDYYKSMDIFKEICDNYFFARDKKEESINESTFIPKEVRYFNNSGLMYIDKVYTLNGYINSKSNKVLEALDITIK